MAHSWQPKSDTPSKLPDVVWFVATVAVAALLAFFLVEWLLATPEAGHPIRTSVTAFEDWLGELDLVLVGACSMFAFLILFAFHGQNK